MNNLSIELKRIRDCLAKSVFPTKRSCCALTALVVTVMSLAPAPVIAQTVDAFLFIPGIDGESTDSLHAGWIDVETLGINMTPTKRATQCEVSLVKKLDLASPALWAATTAETVFPEITIEMIVVM